jgi:hypothetical protein
MSDKPATLFTALVSDLADAAKAREEAERAESLARSVSTDALNRLNAAQRAFDAAVAEMKKKAPRDSNWQRDGQPPFLKCT